MSPSPGTPETPEGRVLHTPLTSSPHHLIPPERGSRLLGKGPCWTASTFTQGGTCRAMGRADGVPCGALRVTHRFQVRLEGMALFISPSGSQDTNDQRPLIMKKSPVLPSNQLVLDPEFSSRITSTWPLTLTHGVVPPPANNNEDKATPD